MDSSTQYKNLFKSVLCYLIAIFAITAENSGWQTFGAVVYWIMAVLMFISGTAFMVFSDKMDRDTVERLVKNKKQFNVIINPKVPYVLIAMAMTVITAYFPFDTGYVTTGVAFLIGYLYMLVGFYFFRKELVDKSKLYGYFN